MIPRDYNDINKFKEFAARLFASDPAFKSSAGATREDIDRVREVAARPLPPLYLEYLTEFGSNDGPIKLCDDSGCSARVLLAHIEKKKAKNLEYPIWPENCVLIGIRALSYARSLWYENEGEPVVITNDFEDIEEVIADSFGTYLYRQAWRHRYFTGSSIGLECSADETLETYVEKLKGLGYQSTFFSDRYWAALEADEVKLLARVKSGTFRIGVSGDLAISVADAESKIRLAFEMNEA